MILICVWSTAKYKKYITYIFYCILKIKMTSKRGKEQLTRGSNSDTTDNESASREWLGS